MGHGFYPYGIYCLLQGDIKTTTAWQVLWNMCIWGALRSQVRSIHEKVSLWWRQREKEKAIERVRGTERPQFPSVLHHSILFLSAFKQANLFL